MNSSIFKILPVGLMLFSSFFGAGNLIFPPALGAGAGQEFWPAIIGFLVTGVGLPLLGIVVVAKTKSDNPEKIASGVHPLFATILLVTVALTIGPFFAIPRTAAVSFDIGIRPFLNQSGSEMFSLPLIIYSFVFFVLTYYFSVNPGKVLGWLGKVLTPLLLISLGVLLIKALLSPMGAPLAPLEAYTYAPFFKGFQDGYQTMDLLASCLFGTLVVLEIKANKLADDSNLVKTCLQAGVIAIVLLGIIYSALGYVGATSVGTIGRFANGGIALAAIANSYLGDSGSIILAVVIILACLTTSVGVTVSCSSYFVKVAKDKIAYSRFVSGITILSFIFANFGLTKIIAFSIPVLVALYPIIIALVFLNLFGKLFDNRVLVYRCAIVLTAIMSLFDGLKVVSSEIGGIEVVTHIDLVLGAIFPFYNVGFGWFIPMLVGALIGYLWSKSIKE